MLLFFRLKHHYLSQFLLFAFLIYPLRFEFFVLWILFHLVIQLFVFLKFQFLLFLFCSEILFDYFYSHFLIEVFFPFLSFSFLLLSFFQSSLYHFLYFYSNYPSLILIVLEDFHIPFQYQVFLNAHFLHFQFGYLIQIIWNLLFLIFYLSFPFLEYFDKD